MKTCHYHPRTMLAVLVCTGLGLLNLGSLKADELLGRAEITRRAHGVRHVLESTDARINIEPKETIHLDLHLSVNRGRATIVAPNGGAFNAGQKVVEIDMAKNGPVVSFDFSAGPSAGRYTVELTHGASTRTFEFWAGAEPPRGKPGPALTFDGNH